MIIKNFSHAVRSQIPPDLYHIIRLASEAAREKNVRLVLVGGLVRDLILGWQITDIDFMADSPANAFVDLLAEKVKGKVVSHERFLTFSIHTDSGIKVDITTARKETYPKPAVLPEVTPSTIENDLSRRDFTINAMAHWLEGGGDDDILDPFNGQNDLGAKKIRVLHENSFVDDPTRLFRAVRFAGRLGFDIEDETKAYMIEAIKNEGPKSLSPVRLRHEFELILKEEKPLPAIELLEKQGLLKFIDAEWKLQDSHRSSLAGKSDFDSRLVSWFKPWGKEKVEIMLRKLEFEKNVKRKVLDGI